MRSENATTSASILEATAALAVLTASAGRWATLPAYTEMLPLQTITSSMAIIKSVQYKPS
jgi:hypothetical protein